MLDEIIATRFDRRMQNGKTCPCLLSGLRDGNEEIEVIAKFSAGCERGSGGLVAEAIAAMLATDIGLPVPEPFRVSFSPDFADLAPDSTVTHYLRTSVPVAFGSKKLPPGFSVPPSDNAIPRSLRDQAAEIFAFDMLIQNPDRRPDNPNCLSDGRNFAIIDHELAFMTTGIIGWQAPWKVGGIDRLNSASHHVFFAGLTGKPPDFSRLENAWAAISDARLAEYQAVLPAVWVGNGEVAKEILDYITQLRDNIKPALAEAARVLS